MAVVVVAAMTAAGVCWMVVLGGGSGGGGGDGSSGGRLGWRRAPATCRRALEAYDAAHPRDMACVLVLSKGSGAG
jgi:hypothetical protein